MILKLFNTSHETPAVWYCNLIDYMHSHCQGNAITKTFNDILDEYNAVFNLNGIIYDSYLKFETNEDIIRFLLKWS